MTEDLPLRSVLDSDLALSIADARADDAPLVWVNAAFTRLTGYPIDEILGRNCRFLQGADTDPTEVARIRTALDERRTVSTVIRNYRRDGSSFWNQVLISPMNDETGTTTHFIGVQALLSTELPAEHPRELEESLDERATARLDLLAHVSDELTRILDYDAAADSLADIVIPALATWGYVAMTDERGRFTRVHMVTSDPADLDVALRLTQGDLGWLYRAPKVVEALHSPPGFVAWPYLIDLPSLPGRMTPLQLELLHRLGLGSAMIVPLRARDRVIGILCLVHVDEFSQDAVVTAAHLGRRAGLALDNVRLLVAERSAALTLQQSLLPTISDVPGLDVATAYVPSGRQAQVGGDWFDVLPLPDGTVGLAVGDVVGHDLRAAASMGQLRSLLRSYAWEGSSPGAVLSRADELVRGLDIADIATCVYVRWTTAEAGAHVTYARAGHPPPLLRLPGGSVVALDEGLSMPIGVKGPGGAEASIDVPAGAVLVLYTDGLVERRDRGLREGIAGLSAELARTPEGASAATIRDQLVETLVGTHQEDDVCLLVVRGA